MPNHTIRVDDAGNFFEDDDRFECDFCGATGDIEDSYDTNDHRYMCEACYLDLHEVEARRESEWMQRHHVMFAVFPTDVDYMLRENPDWRPPARGDVG